VRRRGRNGWHLCLTKTRSAAHNEPMLGVSVS
jgi:hypothetical protein